MKRVKDTYIDSIAKLCAKYVAKELHGAKLKAELSNGWDFTISKPLALFLLHSGIINDNKNGCIMSKEYGQDNNEEENMWNGVVQEDVECLYDDEYVNFAISR